MSFKQDFRSVFLALRRRSPVVVDVPVPVRKVLLQRYMDMSMRNGRLSLLSLGLLLFGMAYEAPLAPRLAAWVLLGAAYGARVWRSRVLQRRLERADPTDAPRSDSVYDLLVFFSSSVWGVAPFFVQPWISPLNTLCVLYAGFIATALLCVTYIMALPAGVVLVVASIVPIIAFMLLQGSFVLGALALGTLTCTAALLMRVASAHGTLLQALAAERQNAALVLELQQYRAALETENATLDSSLRAASQAADRDPLTGLYNRRHVLGFAQALAQAVNAQEEQVTICMIDVDHFKLVNDRHGHLVGDQVLKAVAALLEARLRDGDCLARFGGEEFIAVLRHCDLNRGLRVAESVRHNVAASQIRTAAGEVPITVSLGMAQWADGETFEQALERADRALYDAKHGGRDRVVIDLPDRGGLGTPPMEYPPPGGPLH